MRTVRKLVKLLSTSSYFTFRKLFSTVPAPATSNLCLKGMKIDTPQFRSLFTPELEVLINLFKKYGYELRVAGGAVRDLLLGTMPADVDFATTATPAQMMEIFEKENIRMLNKKGEKHGTVTCRINDKENFEVTTLRIDRVCDGRHAEVEFTTDWVKDANRRDLTVNSLFLGFDGTIYDYFGGVEDLIKRRIVFVGQAEQRIQEDYLRILRYFRFYGRFANTPSEHESDTLRSICSNVNGLSRISGERLWVELKKIAAGRFAGPVMRTIFQCGIFPFVGLPTNANVEEFERVWNLGKDLEPKPMTMLSSLFNTDTQVLEFDKRIKLSNKERLLGLFIVTQRNLTDLNQLSDPYKYFCDLTLDQLNPGHTADGSVENVHELLKYFGLKDLLEKIKQWDVPKFPVNGGMLLSKGVRQGPAMRQLLQKLFDVWKTSNYKATSEELLDQINNFYDKDKSKSPPKKHRSKSPPSENTP